MLQKLINFFTNFLLPAKSDSFNFNLERGDALVFGDHTIHRTFTPPAKRVDRMSLEFRLIKEVDKLPDRDYFSLKDKHFIQT